MKKQFLALAFMLLVANTATPFDQNIFSYFKSNASASMTLGTTGAPTKIILASASATTGVTNLTGTQILNKLARYLDAQNVPHENRWAVVDPYFLENLRDDNSKLVNDLYVNKGVLNNGMVTTMPVHGFKLYMSNNLPYVGTGPTATSGSNYGYVFAGHISAVATAEQIKTSEKLRAERTFADIVRGLHIFGRKLLRSPSLAACIYNNAA